MFIAKEENVLDAFAGQMYLCDFGKNMNGLGPGGTNITAPRLYSWDQWAVRNYVAVHKSSTVSSLETSPIH